MKRTYLLIIFVGLVVIIAVSLRIYSQLHRKEVSITLNAHPVKERISIPAPGDYVADPMVFPEEAQRGPKRIISLAPSVTEIVCALGLDDRLVGRTQYCHYPDRIKSVPVVGAFLDTNLERIISLKPDLVLTPTNSRQTIDQLQDLKIPYQSVPHETIEDIYKAILQIGRFCDRPQTAQSLVDAIKKDLDSLQASVQSLSLPSRRVMVVLGPLPMPPQSIFVAGPGLFLDDLVTMAGHNNIAAEVLKSSHGEIPLEKLCVLNPEAILEFREDDGDRVMKEVYTSWAELGILQAIEHQRVRSVGGSEWLSAGPRIAIELHRFITVLSEFR